MDARSLALLHQYADMLPSLADYPVSTLRFAAGAFLAHAGDSLTRLCFVVAGSVTVYQLMENGRVSLLREYSSVQTIGELEFLMDYPTLTSDVRADTDGVMLVIPLEGARERLYADAALLRYLGREVARKLERTSRLGTQDRLYPIAQRLAAYLLYAQKAGHVRIHLTRLSELMGTSYRHLLRTLQQFCDAGWLLRENGGYRILQTEQLARMGRGIRYD